MYIAINHLILTSSPFLVHRHLKLFQQLWKNRIFLVFNSFNKTALFNFVIHKFCRISMCTTHNRWSVFFVLSSFKSDDKTRTASNKNNIGKKSATTKYAMYLCSICNFVFISFNSTLARARKKNNSTTQST